MPGSDSPPHVRPNLTLNMEQTLEVRWFYEGAPPEDVVEWFQTFDPTLEPEREDLYLFSQDPSLNVKLREGMLQLKRQSGRRARTAFSERAVGFREYWQKWSFPLTDNAPDPFTDDPSGLWLPVTKVRMQRAFSGADQTALLDTLIEPTPTTALVELTRVTYSTQTAWTVCIEAQGPTEALSGTLQQMGEHVFREGPFPTLRLPHSYGYVRWLETVHPGSPSWRR